MKLVTFLNLQNQERLGFVCQDQVVDLELGAREICAELPDDILDFLNNLPESYEVAQKVEAAFLKGMSKR